MSGPGTGAPGPVRLLAPAKLTVSLAVTGVRPDGFHQLDAEMVTLDLADELVVEPDGEGLSLVFDGPPQIPLDTGPANLVSRALAACGRRAGVAVTKRIPVGGGLGGGSADAAAILRWAGVDDPGVALALGSDVPFCVAGGRARVRGVGEQVTPLPFRPCSYALVLPPFGVETAAVYRAWDALGGGSGGDPGGGPPAAAPPGPPAGPPPPPVAGRNELTAAALLVEPRLAAWRDALAEVTGVPAVLAGSGSTWFADLGPGDAAPPHLDGLRVRVGTDEAPVVLARAVPAGWTG